MKRIKLMGMVVFVCVFGAIAFAYNDGGSYADQLEKPMLPVGSQYQVTTDPVTQIERYNVNQFNNDPGVLIAPAREQKVELVPAPSQAPANATVEHQRTVIPSKDAVILKTQYCDEEKCDKWN